MSRLELIETIPVANVLGECIVWDAPNASVWWTDIQGESLFQYRLRDSYLRRYEVPERLCSFGLVDGQDCLICAFESGLALFRPDHPQAEWLYRPELGFSGTRFNDGRVDRQGRFWAGTMVEHESACDAEGGRVRGSLYCFSTAGPRRAFGDVTISNGLAFSPSGEVMYFADSPTRQILAFDLDTASGELGASRVFTEVESPGVPDGSTVDQAGYLWNAEWGGARITRYSPEGQVAERFDLPVSQPTCLCFGGDDLSVLFVTTATEGLDEGAMRAEPEAGNLLVYQTGFRGLREARYRA